MEELKENKIIQVETQQQMKIDQQQMKTEQTMQEISKNPSSIDKKGANWIGKMVINEKASTFPEIPTFIKDNGVTRFWQD